MLYRVTPFLVITVIIVFFLCCETLLAEEAKPFIYNNKGKRDPFISLITSATRSYTSLENVETVSDLILEGIFWDPKGGSIAVLNGVILKEGDIVNNICIQRITPRKVFLKINDQKCEINLQKKEE